MIENLSGRVYDFYTIMRSKNNSFSFDKSGLIKFEIKLISCLYMSIVEIKNNSKISNLTAAALSNLFTFQCFEYYYRDFPEMYKLCTELRLILVKYNDEWNNFDLELSINGDDESWIRYIGESILLM